jgi:hypothetical protein
MKNIIDFMMGRSNKIARDFAFASLAIVAMSLVAMTYVNHMVDNLRVAQKQQLPTKIQTVQTRGNGELTTITRSVLDDPLVTGSITGRRVTLDPCSGQEKK